MIYSASSVTYTPSTAGHPTTGTWAYESLVVDSNDALWICTVAGTPGTWAEVAGGSGVSLPLTVANGGQGGSTLSAYELVAGGITNTSPVQSVASSGNTGWLLTDQGASALPAFTAPPQIPWLPADDGLVAASWDPELCLTGSGPQATTLYLTRIIPRTPVTATNLVLSVDTAASAATSTGTFVGLYQQVSTSLTLLTGSSDMGSVFHSSAGSGAPTTCAFTTPQSLVAGGVYYGGLLVNMSSGPAIYQTGQRNSGNISTGTWQRVLVYNNGGPTTLPATITTGNLANTGFYALGFWMGLS